MRGDHLDLLNGLLDRAPWTSRPVRVVVWALYILSGAWLVVAAVGIVLCIGGFVWRLVRLRDPLDGHRCDEFNLLILAATVLVITARYAA